MNNDVKFMARGKSYIAVEGQGVRRTREQQSVMGWRQRGTDGGGRGGGNVGG